MKYETQLNDQDHLMGQEGIHSHVLKITLNYLASVSYLHLHI